MSFTSLLSVPLKLGRKKQGRKKVMGLEILKLCCKAACLELLPVLLFPRIFFFLLDNFSGVKTCCLCVCVDMWRNPHFEF